MGGDRRRAAAGARSIAGPAALGPAVLFLLLAPFGCGGGDGGITEITEPADDDDEPALEDTGTFTGEAASLGDGTVRVWAELEGGAPIRLGVRLTEEAVGSLPGTTERLSLDLPKEARAFTIYDHVLFDWNPYGHAPADLYSEAHFDVHFYMIPAGEREAIPGGAGAVVQPVASQYLPAHYVMEGALVEAMGVHWADTTSAEFEGTFDRTLLLVSYEARIIAIEPMITLAHIEATTDEPVTIRQPDGYQRTGHYPTRYRMEYDPAAGEYRVTLESFVSRTGS